MRKRKTATSQFIYYTKTERRSYQGPIFFYSKEEWVQYAKFHSLLSINGTDDSMQGLSEGANVVSAMSNQNSTHHLKKKTIHINKST